MDELHTHSHSHSYSHLQSVWVIGKAKRENAIFPRLRLLYPGLRTNMEPTLAWRDTKYPSLEIISTE